MNFKRRYLEAIKVAIERDIVLDEIAGPERTITAYAHKDDDLGNQQIVVEVCNTTTGEFWIRQYNVPADVVYFIETKEVMEVQQ